jgi:UDP-glucose 4-epimerase
MRALVVGGQGFLGGAVVDELLLRGCSVSVLDPGASEARCDERFGPGRVQAIPGSVLDRGSLPEAFAECDEVYHFGGVLGTSELNDRLRDAVEANVLGALNVFEAALEVGVPMVFYPSKPSVWRNAYTISKQAAEDLAMLFSSLHPVRVCVLRYFNAFGPRQAVGPVRKIIPTFATQAMARQPLTVFGDGEQTVDLIHCADLARLTVDFTRSGYEGEPLDCGSGVEMTVNDVAGLVNEYFENSGVHHLPMRPGEVPGTRLRADLGGLSEVLGAPDFSGFPASLYETLDWYARAGRA